MDSDKRSARVERLELVETGRRRRWSEDEKLKIVIESYDAWSAGRSLLCLDFALFRNIPYSQRRK
jgi:hypothetical protein